MCVIPKTLYYAGITEGVRKPKSFAKIKLPGFKFGYLAYYLETIKMILETRKLLWNEKLQSFQLVNEQVINFINYHEKDSIGSWRKAFPRFLKGVTNSALEKLKKRTRRNF